MAIDLEAKCRCGCSRALHSHVRFAVEPAIGACLMCGEKKCARFIGDDVRYTGNPVGDSTRLLVDERNAMAAQWVPTAPGPVTFAKPAPDTTELRDDFAVKAMQALIVGHGMNASTWIAGEAYRLADAMLKARQEAR